MNPFSISESKANEIEFDEQVVILEFGENIHYHFQ